ncbi:MAG: hypothetical protein FWG41_03275 [Methanomassiliicoccaceae archaeon]|nr:hypothetical protein [Methanomassiliicoccaceae archaeon]
MTEYTAQAASPLVNGEVKLTIAEHAFLVTGLLDVAEVPFSRVNALEFENYVVTSKTDEGDFSFSRMGSWAQPFYDAMWEAYNNAVLRALFVSGSSAVSNAGGDYHFAENGVSLSGKAPFRVYENCIISLPPNSNARRIPLCFVSGLEKGAFEFKLKLNTGEEYTFSKLGHGTEPFADAVEKNIRAMRDRTIAAVKELDPSMTMTQASQIAKLMPEGAAAQIGQLAAIAPSFAAAVEAKISQTRAASSYNAFKELCDPAMMWIGFKKNEFPLDGANGETPPDDESTDAEPDPYLFWMIAPSPNGQYAAVEFAVQPGEGAATFVYRTGGDFSRSAIQLNRALEAINFRREVIRLNEEELLKPENADYYMAAKRTASLQYVRDNFVGRVIHSSQESWKRKLMELWK